MSVAVLMIAWLACAPMGGPGKVDALPGRAVGRLGTLAFAHDQAVQSIAFSRDGRRIVTATARGFHVWQAESGAEVGRVDFDSVLPTTRSGTKAAVRFGKNDHLLVGCTAAGYFLWDLDQQKAVQRQEMAVQRAAFSSNGRWLGVVSVQGELSVFDVENWQRIGTALHAKAKSTAIAISANGGQAALGDAQGGIHVFDVQSGRKVEGDLQANEIHALLFLPKSQTLVSSTSYSGLIRTWKLEKADKRPLVPPTGDGVVERDFAVSSDGALLAWDDGYGAIVWDLQKGARKFKFAATSDAAGPLAFSPDRTRLATAQGQAVQLWDLQKGKLLNPREGQRGPIVAAAFTPGANAIVTLSEDERLIHWQPGGSVNSVRVLKGIARAPAPGFARGGSALGLVNAGDVQLRILSDFRVGQTVRTQSDKIEAIALSPDAKTLAVGLRTEPKKKKGSPQTTVRIYNAATGMLDKEFAPTLNQIHALRFSSDGQDILVRGATFTNPKNAEADMQHKLLAYALPTRTVRYTLELDRSRGVLEFTKDGKQFVTTDRSGALMLFDGMTGQPIRTLHKLLVTAVAVSPRTGAMAVALGSSQTRIEIWDLAANQMLATLAGGHRGAVRCLAFSDDDALLMSGSSDTTALIWDLKGL